MDKIAVLIPCYNEAKTIRKVVHDFLDVLPADGIVYVYDNNSTDDTARIAADAGAVVCREPQQGKGNVVRRMFREINAECYILVDGDDTYPAEYAPAMIQEILSGADMVVGDRLSSTYYEENKRPFHNFGNNLVKNGINILFNSEIQDIMTGYRAFSYEFVKTFPILSKGFEIETEMTIHAVDKNMLVRNIVIDYRDRPEGSVSKLNTYADGAKVLLTIFKLFRTYRPMAFFSLLALTLILIAAVLFFPVLVTYFNTGLVPNFPTLIVSGFIALAAIQSFFGGLILDTIIQKNRQDFEFKLQIISNEKHQRMEKELTHI